MKRSFIVFFWVSALLLPGVILLVQARIIDMHLHSYTESSLVGTWKVLADQQVDSMGDIIAQDTSVSGLLIYTPEGKMNVQILWRGRRAPIMTDTIMDKDGNSTGLGLGTNTWSSYQSGKIIDTYDAYFGDYSVDGVRRIITHTLSGNLRPEKAGTIFRRRFRLEGNILFLSSTDPTMKWQVKFVKVK